MTKLKYIKKKFLFDRYNIKPNSKTIDVRVLKNGKRKTLTRIVINKFYKTMQNFKNIEKNEMCKVITQYDKLRYKLLTCFFITFCRNFVRINGY